MHAYNIILGQSTMKKFACFQQKLVLANLKLYNAIR